MAVKTSWSSGDVLTAADLTDTFASKLDLAGGKILQIVRATDGTLRSTTSTSYVDVSGMSVTITPQKSDSTILVVATGWMSVSSTGDTNNYGFFRLTDNSNNALSGAQNTAFGLDNLTGTATRVYYSGFALVGYSTPATTSATLYKLQLRSVNASTTTGVRNNDQTGQILAIEVSA